MALHFQRTRLLVLCKTYPSPSAGYVETSCVAAMTEEGRLIRLYPVPFRLLEETAQFRKWQWIEADIAKATDDHRPESYRLRADTLRCTDEPISPRNDWSDRRFWLERLPIYRSFKDLDQARVEKKVTLGMLSGQHVESLQIAPTRNPEWTADELAKLSQAQRDLFSDNEGRALRELRKLPFDFHYRYRPIDVPNAIASTHKIVDWEAGALFWNLQRSHPENWESPFRQKFEQELPTRDLMFLMGTIHRFPDQWLIVSVIYPPKQRALRLL
ncbi:MAG: hypothetical protein R3E77_00515 [Steroidobacteraceae bacterium]